MSPCLLHGDIFSNCNKMHTKYFLAKTKFLFDFACGACYNDLWSYQYYRKEALTMQNSASRQDLLFQFHGTPPIGTSLSLALQHLVAMIVGCVTPPIIIAGAIGLSQADRVL